MRTRSVARRDDAAALLPRIARRDEQHLVEPERGAHVDRDHDVRVVDRIEGATEDTEARHLDDSTDGSMTVRDTARGNSGYRRPSVGRVRP